MHKTMQMVEEVAVYYSRGYGGINITSVMEQMPLASSRSLNLVVCILLCVLDQVQGFPSDATLFQ
jgi:hypothetical protein